MRDGFSFITHNMLEPNILASILSEPKDLVPMNYVYNRREIISIAVKFSNTGQRHNRNNAISAFDLQLVVILKYVINQTKL